MSGHIHVRPESERQRVASRREFPLPWGEDAGEGVEEFSLDPLSPRPYRTDTFGRVTLSPGEREYSVVAEIGVFADIVLFLKIVPRIFTAFQPRARMRRQVIHSECSEIPGFHPPTCMRAMRRTIEPSGK